MKTLYTSFLIAFSVSPLFAQVSTDSELFLDLKKQDSLFFARGFNDCDMAYLEEVIHPDLVFYHDQSGIQGREKFFENTKKYLCGNPDLKPIRKLKEGSLEVFPMYSNGELYGAIQHGVHYFYLREPGKQDLKTGVARFTHLYLLVDGKWKLKEVLSYDHQPISD
jgi:hypothetical protein